MEQKDSFARHTARRANEAVRAVRDDMTALWVRLGVVESKTVGIPVGRCGLCGAPTRNRYCYAHDFMEGEE